MCMITSHDLVQQEWVSTLIGPAVIRRLREKTLRHLNQKMFVSSSPAASSEPPAVLTFLHSQLGGGRPRRRWSGSAGRTERCGGIFLMWIERRASCHFLLTLLLKFYVGKRGSFSSELKSSRWGVCLSKIETRPMIEGKNCRVNCR